MTDGYRTIIIDPPWPQKGGGTLRKGTAMHFRGAGGASLPMPYKTMPVERIVDLPVRELADPTGSHVYLWTTNGFLRQAYEVLDAWGYDQPPTVLVWAKNTMGKGLGGRFGISTEFCLHAARGRVDTEGREKVRGTWRNWKRPYDARGKPRHSAKPPAFRVEWVEAASPGPYLEMFARDPWPGWDAWGDQALNDVPVPALERELLTRESAPPEAPAPVDLGLFDMTTTEGSVGGP